MSTITHRLVFTLVGIVALAGALQSADQQDATTPNPPAVTLAAVATDKADYAPGTLAAIVGSGFLPGEVVRLIVLHADGRPSTGNDHLPWEVTADPLGGFATSWHV